MENAKSELIFYHIGRIVKLVDPKNSKNFDKKRKAVIEMWDNNIITCETGPASPHDGDFVIVRFKGIIQGNNNLFMNPSEITDILSNSTGEQVWQNYKSFYDKTKPAHPLTG
jgi:hypothetical protein